MLLVLLLLLLVLIYPLTALALNQPVFDLETNRELFQMMHASQFDRVDSALAFWNNHLDALTTPDEQVLFFRAAAVFNVYKDGSRASEGWFERCIPLLPSVKDPELKGRMYMDLGYYYTDIDNYLLAEKYSNEAMKVCQAYEMPFMQAEVAMARAMLWRKLGALHQAEQELEMNQEVYNDLPQEDPMYFNYLRIQLAIKQDQKNWRECEDILQKMKDNSETVHQDFLLAIYHEDAARLAFDRGQSFLALHHAEELLALNQTLESKEGMAYAYLAMAKARLLLQEYRLAREALVAIDQNWIKEIASIEFLLTYYETYIEILVQLNDHNEIFNLSQLQNKALAKMDSLRLVQSTILTETMEQLREEWSVQENDFRSAIKRRTALEVLLTSLLIILSGLIIYKMRTRWLNKLNLRHREIKEIEKQLAAKEEERTALEIEVRHLTNLLNNTKLLSERALHTDKERSKEEWERLLDTELRDSDYRLLCLLASEPELGNAQLAERLFLSQDGMRTSLKRLYQFFHIETKGESRRVSLILRILSF